VLPAVIWQLAYRLIAADGDAGKHDIGSRSFCLAINGLCAAAESPFALIDCGLKRVKLSVRISWFCVVKYLCLCRIGCDYSCR
jgi:hypothetical protein